MTLNQKRFVQAAASLVLVIAMSLRPDIAGWGMIALVAAFGIGVGTSEAFARRWGLL